MITNPGGQIPPDDVIGRDALIRRLWRILGRQSLVLSAERRMGKTCIVKKMTAESPPDKLCIYRDLEGIRTPLEFVQTVVDDVENYLGRTNRTANRVRGFLSHLSGAEVGGIIKIPDIASTHWKTLSTRTIEDLVENQDQTVVLFWDEMPLMLYNIKNRESEDVAMDVLSVADEPLTFDDLFNRLKSRMETEDSETTRDVLALLQRDHYVIQQTDGKYRFQFPIIQRWWRIHRGLRS